MRKTLFTILLVVLFMSSGFAQKGVISLNSIKRGIQMTENNFEKLILTLSPLQKVQFFASTLECRKNYFSDYSEFIFPMQF